MNNEELLEKITKRMSEEINNTKEELLKKMDDKMKEQMHIICHVS